MKRHWLIGAILLALILPSAAQSIITGTGAYFLVYNDSQFYSQSGSSYFVFTAPNGNLSNYKNGRDYTQSIKVATTNPPFPNNTLFNWNLGSLPSASGIYGYWFLAYGQFDGGTPAVPIPVTQVSAINTLQQTINLAFAGTANNYDVIDDIYLVASNGTTNEFEWSIFLHTPSYSATYVNSQTQIGTTTISGIAWTVAINNGDSPPTILWMPTNQADITNSTLDLKAMLTYLVAQGTISATTNYFANLSLGVEINQGAGAMQVNSIAMLYN